MTKIIDIYDVLPEIFTTKNVYSAYKRKMTIRTVDRMIGRYIRSGMVFRIKRGVYAKTDANQFAVALQVYAGYIGFSSALYLYGLKTELESNIYVCVSKAKKPASFMNTRIIPVDMGMFSYGTVLLNDIVVSTYAKTLFDMLYKPRYANFFDFFRALNTRKLTKEELEEFLYYLKDADISTIRRAGYALEGKTPAWFIKKIEAMDNKKGTSFFMHNVAAHFNSKWRIYDDENVIRWSDAI